MLGQSVPTATARPCRLKEFSERWEVDKYLSATGYLPPNVKPFFVALPKASPVRGPVNSGHFGALLSSSSSSFINEWKQY